MRSGWISLHRSLQEHWIWEDGREFSKVEAWIYLLMAARHDKEPIRVLIKDKVLFCNRGESLRSLETLSKDWNWNRSKVRRFLKLLEKENMIRHASETVTSRITVCNYDTYQSGSGLSETAIETQVKHTRNASETHSTINNNGNNEKNGNKTPSPKASPSALEIDFEEAWIAYGKKGSKKTSLKYWKKLSQAHRAEIKQRIPLYVEEQEDPKFQKDFNGWINPAHNRWQNALKSELKPAIATPTIQKAKGLPEPENWRKAMEIKLKDAPAPLIRFKQGKAETKWSHVETTMQADLIAICKEHEL